METSACTTLQNDDDNIDPLYNRRKNLEDILTRVNKMRTLCRFVCCPMGFDATNIQGARRADVDAHIQMAIDNAFVTAEQGIMAAIALCSFR